MFLYSQHRQMYNGIVIYKKIILDKNKKGSNARNTLTPIMRKRGCLYYSK